MKKLNKLLFVLICLVATVYGGACPAAGDPSYIANCISCISSGSTFLC